MFDISTVNDVFIKATSEGSRVAVLWQDAEGVWVPITPPGLYGKIRALADVLRAWGVGKGDRVMLLSENRWEWAVTDFAALAIGAVDVPLYLTLTAEQIGYMLRDSGARVAFVSNAEQYSKVLAAGELPALEHIVVMDEVSLEGAKNFSALMSEALTKQEPDQAFDALVRAVLPEDLATIIYTSGTTDEPKGVCLTHRNLASNISVSTCPMRLTDADSCISFLPLSHVTARHTDYALMYQGVLLAYCPAFDRLPEAMKAVRPTIFIGVPRVYEKIRAAVEAKSSPSALKSRILRWALGIGRQNRQATMQGLEPSGAAWKLAKKLVFGKIRDAYGGRVRIWISGGAPLGMETAGWFADANIRIFEGYGLTETSPVLALNYPDAHRMGTVGRLMPNVEGRFAEDGELEVRGPSVFGSYWGKPEQTAEAFTEDGWFRTGDIGNLDGDGFLSITDRKKELLKTSGGKLIAPQPIENKLKAHALVEHAAVVGDKQKYAAVVISPNFPALEGWAKTEGIRFADRQELVRNPKVLDLYLGLVGTVNATLANYETLKRVAVVGQDWTIEGGELTPSMKLKRRVIEQRHARDIAALFR